MTTENVVSNRAISLMMAKIKSESEIDKNPHQYIEDLINSYNDVITARDLERISLEIHCRGLKDVLVECHHEYVMYDSDYHANVTELLIKQVTEIENT